MVIGEQPTHGWNPPALAELGGVSYASEPTLLPTELTARLDRILEATKYALQAVSAEQLQISIPRRERTRYDVGYHISRRGLRFCDAAIEERFPEAWLRDAVHPR